MNLSFSEELNGKPQYFIRKIWRSLSLKIQHNDFDTFESAHRLRFNTGFSKPENGTDALSAKIHTIRRFRTHASGTIASRQWKKGMAIHLSINPGTSDYFRFAPLICCTALQQVEITWPTGSEIGLPEIRIDQRRLTPQEIDLLAINDGFDTTAAFLNYFNLNFKGVLIHWTNFSY
ncbi:hypothetical protein [Pedobacter duraquae]|uniref:Uncharacterized protein n=1 Tax=Pedobacter duraquae TaxID=425511 RepID=A0A4R6IL63_9SPHI|nr:hypothetical protein [Pedobacter duraquae]TDO22859.1 hypothetical protein CLV32_1844 [Pedobacter duraquae]